MKGRLIIVLFIARMILYGQVVSNQDSLKLKQIELTEVEVAAQKDNSFGISRLNNVEGTAIFAGKKTEAIYVGDLNANLAANNSRQIFAKVAGINIFENDGSGASVGIGGRGLNPNRISNFNTRQNGYDISADALGYPESYYTPPTEAINRIEVLRGAASLQYGTQFGGMINYKFNEAPNSKKFSGNFRQTAGSFGFINSFNQISGKASKISYNAFYQFKSYEGWRRRSTLNSHNAFISLKYQITERLDLRAEYTFLNYLAQQPGGLTDKQFKSDMYLVNRNRNWFKVNWNLFSLSSNYSVSDATKINLMFFSLNAGRDALGVLTRIDRTDDTSANRNLLSDKYSNFGVELRTLHRYLFLNKNSNFLIGGRYYSGLTIRKQGDADKSNKAVFKFLNEENLENSSYSFPSQNIAFFSENIFQITNKWNLTPGIRYEYIKTNADGYYRLLNKDLAGNILLDMKIDDNRSRSRQFLLVGLGSQYKFHQACEAYVNFSQNYRSINFNDMRVLNPNFQIDPNLKDESGFTVDGGLRGTIKNLLYYDISIFSLNYNNRIGTVLTSDSISFQIIRYRTNIGTSRNIGIEAFAEVDWMKLISKTAKHKVSTFVNFATIDARYTDKKQKAYYNNKVEYVPDVIIRSGISYAFKGFGFTYQVSYTSKQFSDATNSQTSSSGIYGVVPAYTVMDLSFNYTWKFLGLNAGINNLANEKYFTRRAEGYPGPGILPADPVNGYVTLQLKF